MKNKTIGINHKPYFIADIAANHDGDIERAYKLIALAKEAGADAAKFQNFKAKWIVSKHGFDSMGAQLSHQANWKKSVYKTYEDASVSDDWSILLKAKCDEVGIEYMTSPYDFPSVDLADQFVNAFKIGSGDITWTEIITHMAMKQKPILLATGASTLEDVDRAMDVILKHTNEIILMQCNTNYTGSAENFQYINLNVLNTYKERYPNVILGLSDHTHGHTTVLGAMMLGARVFEKHFTDDTQRTGPDHKFSMTPKTWREMVDAANELYLAMGDGIKQIEANESETVSVQRRALYTTKALKAGDVIKSEHLIPLRPAKKNGILPYEADEIIGKKIISDIPEDCMLIWENICK